MSDLESTIEQIETLATDGDFDAAKAKLKFAFETFGESPELVVTQIEVDLEREDFESVKKAVAQTLPIVDDHEVVARLQTALGYAQFYTDDIDEARVAFNAAVGADPELLNALTGRAMVHEHMGYINAAMLDLDRIIELDDQDGQPFAIRGSIHMRMGNMEIAEADLDHAIRMDPDDEESRLSLGRIYALTGKTSQAIDTLGPLVDDGESEECVGPAALLRSQLSITLRATEAALEDAEKVIALQPDLPWGYLQAAASVIAHGADGGKAIQLLKDAEAKVRNSRDLPDLYPLKAAAYDLIGKPEKAEETRAEAEGVARLPQYVYGPLNPVQNIPLNPNKPLDIRALLDELFGDAEDAPDGYEALLRDVAKKMPEIVAQNPNVGKIQIDLPEAPGMIGGKRQLVINVGGATS